ncbi:YciI family protein [Undibacterium sp. SXout11W]|uniref:YciI family protein n=1 Tax=Undibacterium sp. SXout11W TaxID=3413050 RepID=UPI003BF1DDAC
MFIIDLDYIKALTEVEKFIPEHRQFLEKYYASAKFLISGRKEPRTGGIIIANCASRDEVETLIQEDPFHREAIARYTITEFIPTMTADFLENLKVA